MKILKLKVHSLVAVCYVDENVRWRTLHSLVSLHSLYMHMLTFLLFHFCTWQNWVLLFKAPHLTILSLSDWNQVSWYSWPSSINLLTRMYFFFFRASVGEQELLKAPGLMELKMEPDMDQVIIWFILFVNQLMKPIPFPHLYTNILSKKTVISTHMSMLVEQ